MKISGLQKLTLLDFPGHVACTVFSAGCDLRCPFCHNASLVKGVPDIMTGEEFFAFLSKRHGILDGVAFTGGEPLLNCDFTDFALRIKDMGFLVKLDTNGTFPNRLRDAVDRAAVDYVAMDIKNSPEKYPLTCGGNVDMDAVAESVQILLKGKVEYEFRTTVVGEYHTDADFIGIGEFIRGAERYYLQQFADSGDILGGAPLTAPSREEMEKYADTVRPYVKSVFLRGVK